MTCTEKLNLSWCLTAFWKPAAMKRLPLKETVASFLKMAGAQADGKMGQNMLDYILQPQVFASKSQGQLFQTKYF